MIYTLTLNPSLDYFVEVADFTLGKTNRSKSETLYPGGKGINVSLMLDILGYSSVALGFYAGVVGQSIAQLLPELSQDFITLPEGNSRINLKVKNMESTEINGAGPEIPVEQANQLKQKIKNLKEEDILVLSGSVPKSLSADIYQQLMELTPCGKVVLDSTGESLLSALGNRPFLIKPNRQELEELFPNETDIPSSARLLQEKGAQNVLVSLGGDGAYFLDAEGKEYLSTAPKGELVQAVGSGDAMVAGFLAGYLETSDYAMAFHNALAAGSAAAFSPHFPKREFVEQLRLSL